MLWTAAAAVFVGSLAATAEVAPDVVPELLPNSVPDGAPPDGAAARARAQPYPPPGYAAQLQPAAGPLPTALFIDLDEAPAPGARRHEGLFVRVQAGPALSALALPGRGPPAHLTGWGGEVALAAGYALLEDLVLHAELALRSALDPRLSGALAPARAVPTAITTLGAGAGVTGYLMPAHFWLTVALLGMQARAVERRSGILVDRSRFGPALALGAGKDWWLSEGWSAGVALRGTVARLPAREAGAVAWTALGVSLALSATFN